VDRKTKQISQKETVRNTVTKTKTIEPFKNTKMSTLRRRTKKLREISRWILRRVSKV